MTLRASFFAFAVLAATGCAASQAQVPATSTTRITAAEVTVADDAPRSGKAQKSKLVADDDKDLVAKDGSRREGGGFSGWK